ncbi:MAG: zinc-binding alcohol dehydrogenase family protein [Caulobacteraceae bacterium]
MKAAVVQEIGHAPMYAEFQEPAPGEDEVRVHVTASALTHFTRLRALGKHYSFAAKPPFVIGIDGIGRLDDGRRVYFLFPPAPFGGMAERTIVRRTQCMTVPDGVDDAALAALADPGMSAWVALEMRARIAPGDTVLVNGATGFAGRVAVQIARHLGAGKVIATGRNREMLHRLRARGADATVSLDPDGQAPIETWQRHFADSIDVVLDYLWGASALQIIKAADAGDTTKRVRFVQIGLSGGDAITLPGALLRASAIEIMGSGTGSVSEDGIFRCIGKLMNAAPSIGFDLATRVLPLSRIEEAWSAGNTSTRIVLDPTA